MKVILIGSDQNCDVTINNTYVSKHHMQIIIHELKKYSIVDLNSKTGTYVNGKRITTEYFLKENDIVKIGNVVLPWKDYLMQFMTQNNTSNNDLLNDDLDSLGTDTLYYIKKVLTNYTKFEGRASKKEFWSFMIAKYILFSLLFIISLFSNFFSVLLIILYLAALLPSFAVSFRRVQDSGNDGILFLIPIFNIILFIKDGIIGPNIFGKQPIK